MLIRNCKLELVKYTIHFPETLSDGLGRVILDEPYEEARQRIKKAHSGSSRDHLWAGFKGLGFGVLGGVTSIIRQTYDGATQEGLQGIITGLGKVPPIVLFINTLY